MKTTFNKKGRFLKIDALLLKLAGAVFLLTALTAQSRQQKFADIDIERVSVAQRSVKFKKVISSQQGGQILGD